MKLLNKEYRSSYDSYEDIFVPTMVEEKMKLAEDLRLVEDKFYKIFDLNPCPMAINTWDDSIIVDVNNAFLEILGVENKKDIIGNVTTEKGLNIIKEKDKQYVISYIKKHGVIKNYLTTLRTINGKRLRGLFSGSIIVLNGQTCLLTICQIVKRRCLFNLNFIF